MLNIHINQIKKDYHLLNLNNDILDNKIYFDYDGRKELMIFSRYPNQPNKIYQILKYKELINFKDRVKFSSYYILGDQMSQSFSFILT